MDLRPTQAAQEGEDRFLHEAAREHGIDPGDLTLDRVTVATSAGTVSALHYRRPGLDTPPTMALLHGGGQNAHTWDLVAAALRMPCVAIDLPGHGSSTWRTDHDYRPRHLAAPVHHALSTLTPDLEVLVGMSLGGMAALTVAAHLPHVRHVVLVDVSPGSSPPPGAAEARAHRPTTGTFEELIAAVGAPPGRPQAGLRHAVWHSTRADPAGRRWRTDPDMTVGSFTDLWPDLIAAAPRLTEVLATEGSFVPADDRRRLRALLGERMLEVTGAAHSIQNTRPVQLAAILSDTVRS